MNYITSCPSCATQFLLHDEHLKAHRGKVQCGNCEHIFNAKNRLTEVSDDIHSPAEYNASIAAAESDETQVLDEKRIDEALSTVLENVPNLKDLATNTAPFATTQSDLAQIDEDKTPYIGAITPDIITPHDANQISAPIIIEDLTANPKFTQAKSKTSYGLIFLAVLLAILAGLQTIYVKRIQIAAEYPQYKAYLVQACQALQCEIPLPKNLDLLTIDDSDMQEDENHANVIKFTSMLINNAQFAQAYPNIELTLTSTDDQPVLRRLIKPAEYLKTGTDVAAGLAGREEMRIQLMINVKDLAVAGYRVLLVY